MENSAINSHRRKSNRKNTLNIALNISMCNAPFDVIQHNRMKYSQLDIKEITDCGDDGDGIEERVGE